MIIATIQFEIEACTCGGYLNEKYHWEAFNTIFSGFNIHNDTVGEYIFANLVIVDVWKGSLPDTLHVHTGFVNGGGAACDFVLSHQDTLIFYGHQSPNFEYPFLSTCELFPYDQDRINTLNIFANPLSIKISNAKVWYDRYQNIISFSNELKNADIRIFDLNGRLVHHSTISHSVSPPTNEILILIIRKNNWVMKERITTRSP